MVYLAFKIKIINTIQYKFQDVEYNLMYTERHLKKDRLEYLIIPQYQYK